MYFFSRKSPSSFSRSYIFSCLAICSTFSGSDPSFVAMKHELLAARASTGSSRAPTHYFLFRAKVQGVEKNISGLPEIESVLYIFGKRITLQTEKSDDVSVSSAGVFFSSVFRTASSVIDFRVLQFISSLHLLLHKLIPNSLRRKSS